jgi:hypothetical protein
MPHRHSKRIVHWFIMLSCIYHRAFSSAPGRSGQYLVGPRYQASLHVTVFDRILSYDTSTLFSRILTLDILPTTCNNQHFTLDISIFNPRPTDKLHFFLAFSLSNRYNCRHRFFLGVSDTNEAKAGKSQLAFYHLHFCVSQLILKILCQSLRSYENVPKLC